MTAPKIAIQARIWGLKNLVAEYPAIFDKVSETGYAGAESRASLLIDDEAGTLDYLKRHPNFSLIGLHTNLKDFDKDDRVAQLDNLLPRMNRAGSKYLIASMGKVQEFDKWFELAAQVTEQCAKYDVQFCYHNHAGEFERGYEFFDGLAAHGIALAADLAWVSKGGKDVVEFIDRYEPHIKYVHVKDYKGEQWKELGEGEMDLPRIFTRLKKLSLPWWTVEQDNTDQDPSVSATISRNYLRNQGL
jgi:sugar phosphate isomerase/epimerase